MREGADQMHAALERQAILPTALPVRERCHAQFVPIIFN